MLPGTSFFRPRPDYADFTLALTNRVSVFRTQFDTVERPRIVSPRPYVLLRRERDLSFIGSEWIGTALLILLGDGVVAAVLLNKSKAQNSGWIVITFGWGFAVMVGAYSVGKFSGGQLNPAVTLGVWINGGITGGQAWHYWIGEMLGAMTGAILVWAAYYLHWAETEDPGLKLAVFSTGPAIRNYAANLITEIIGTCVLVFGILAIVVAPANSPVVHGVPTGVGASG